MSREQGQKIDLSPTAALVLSLSKELFEKNPLTREYLKKIDLSSGRELVEAYRNAGLEELTRQGQCNRKFAIRELILEFVSQNPSAWQVVILASGFSPLGLEIVENTSGKVGKLFEVDTSPSDAKKALYHHLLPSSREKVAFIEMDIRSPALLNELTKYSYSDSLSTIVVMEGITHYLPLGDIRAILNPFHHRDHGNRAIIEYGLPYDKLSDTAAAASKTLFEIIEKRYFPQGTYKYTSDDFRQLFQEMAGDLVRHLPMCDLERWRTGKNRVFSNPESSLVEIVVGSL